MREPKEKWSPPATSPEQREQQLIVLATDLAEQQLRKGVASSPVVVHYLKAASERNKLELEKLRNENEVLRAKAEALESGKQSDAKYKEAIDAFRLYTGNSTEEYEEDYEY